MFIFQLQERYQLIHQQLCQLSTKEEYLKLLNLHVTYLADEQMVVSILLTQNFMHIYGLAIDSHPVNLRIVYTHRYPEEKPRLYFDSQNLSQFYTVPCRDYMSEITAIECPSIQQIISHVASFFQNIQTIQKPHQLGLYYRGQFFHLETFTAILNACQLYTVGVILEDQLAYDRYVIINRFDMILLEPCQLPGYGRLVDVYSLKSITSIAIKRESEDRLLLLMKFADYEVAFQMVSRNPQMFINSIVDKKGRLPKYQQRKSVSAENIPSMKSLDLGDIDERIQLEQAKELTEETFNALVKLYNQAIQYCTLVSQSEHEVYLEKLQRLLSRRGSITGKRISIFEEYNNEQSDKLHDISQLTAASSDLFDLQ